MSVRWDDPQVIASLAYRMTRKLLSVLPVLMRREAAMDAELPVLRHENAVLHRQPGGPVRMGQRADCGSQHCPP